MKKIGAIAIFLGVSLTGCEPPTAAIIRNDLGTPVQMEVIGPKRCSGSGEIGTALILECRLQTIKAINFASHGTKRCHLPASTINRSYVMETSSVWTSKPDIQVLSLSRLKDACQT